MVRKKKVHHFFDSKDVHLNPGIILGIWENGEEWHEHIFVVSFLGSKDKRLEFEVYQRLRSRGCKVVFAYSLFSIARIMTRSNEALIFHGSLSPFKKYFSLILLYYLFHRRVLARVVLVAWGGGDFDAPQKPWGNLYYNVISKFKNIVALSRVDYASCVKLHGSRALQINYIKLKDLGNHQQGDTSSRNRVLVSHSGWSHNRHLKSFELLKSALGEQDEVVCPLAYGDDEYIEMVIEKGREFFGARFSYFADLMAVDEYQSFLKSVDAYVTSADIQTGLFALTSCLANGVKVYCTSNLYQSMSECGFKVFDVNEIPNGTCDDFFYMSNQDSQLNKFLYEKEFGDVEALRSKWNFVYDLGVAK